MQRNSGRYALIVASLVMVLLSVGTVWAQKLPPTKAKKPPAAAAAEPALPQSAEQVDAYMGSLTDEQARKALSRTLKQQLAGKGQTGEVERGMEVGLGLRFSRLADSVVGPEAKARGHGRDGRRRRRHPGRGLGAPDGRGRRAAFCARRCSGWPGSWPSVSCRAGMALRAAHDLTGWMATTAALGRLEFLGRVVAHALVQILGLLVFAAVTFVLFVLVFEKGDPGYELVSVYLVVCYYVMIFAAGARILFAPGAPAPAAVPAARGRCAPGPPLGLGHRRGGGGRDLGRVSCWTRPGWVAPRSCWSTA